MILRDTYHDFMTDEEVVERGFWAQKTWSRRIADLKRRAGIQSDRYLRTNYDRHTCVRTAEIRFDSRDWTGRA